LYASKLLRSASPESRLFLVARNWEKATNAVKEVESVLEGNSVSDRNIFPMVCDHTRLSSVHKFCEDLRIQLRSINTSDGQGRQIGIGIDVLCLNAAILLGENAEAQYTEDGIEITFQTNHLAPFLIANLTFDMINPGGRVVVTSSGLHVFSTFDNFLGVIDPETGQIRKRFAMIDGASFDYKKSYAASKLCNVAFCLGLNRRLQKKGAVAICFTPGLIPSSGLFRHQKRWAETVLKKQAVGMDETPEWGGSMLAWMAIADEAGKPGAYWRAPFGISKRGGTIPGDLFSAPIYEEANDPENQESLWKISAELAGIKSDLIRTIE
jgi:NAD(P)-dependent dehydrogenase (short-subunit alcohol dehydrogenase family)